MLAQRILTAIVGMIAAIFVISYGKWLFAVVTIMISMIGWHEYYKMLQRKNKGISYWLGFLGIPVLLCCFWLGNLQEVLLVFFVLFVFILAKMVIAYGRFSVNDAAFTLFGISYVAFPFAHLPMLRFLEADVTIAVGWGMMSAGAAYLWLAFLGTWASDTFAFFVGSIFGKSKLCPAVSPNKTIEGVLGGLVGSMIAIAIAGYFFHIPFVHTIFLGLLVGIVAPLGDLIESVLKRFAEVKDSGRFLPGHGGVLDRFDSIMFAVPAVYYYVYYFLLK